LVCFQESVKAKRYILKGAGRKKGGGFGKEKGGLSFQARNALRRISSVYADVVRKGHRVKEIPKRRKKKVNKGKKNGATLNVVKKEDRQSSGRTVSIPLVKIARIEIKFPAKRRALLAAAQRS